MSVEVHVARSYDFCAISVRAVATCTSVKQVLNKSSIVRVLHALCLESEPERFTR